MEKGLLEAEKKHLLLMLKEAKEEEIQRIDEAFSRRFAVDAVSFEGNNHVTLEEVETLAQAKKLLNRSEREQKEVLNHLKAYEYVVKSAKEKKELSEEFLKDLHQMILQDIMNAGYYRQVNVQLMGSTHQPPDHVKVYDRMKKFMNNLSEFKGDAIELACYATLGISKIHPFVDGNGRLARLVLNFVLIKNDYLPISLSRIDAKEYFHALDMFKEEKTMDPMVELVSKLLIKRYNEVNQFLSK